MVASNHAGVSKPMINVAGNAVVGYRRTRVVTLMSLLTATLALGGQPADAACVGAGTTTVCTLSTNSAVNFGAGPDGQTVQINPGALVNPTSAAITVRNNSVVVNSGTIAGGNANNAYGINTTGNSNTIVNDGLIQRTGLNANGRPSTSTGSSGMNVSAGSTGNVVTNTGTIAINGINGTGIRDLGTGTSITNTGTITATGVLQPADNPPNFPGGVVLAGPGGTFTNSGSVFSQNDAAVHVLSNGVTINNSGTLTGGTGTAVILAGAGNVLNTAGAVNGDIVMSVGPNQVNATGGTITGAMLTQSGTSTVNLSNAALWNMTGNSNVTNLAVNGFSNITFPGVPPNVADAGVYHTLTVNTLTGTNAGEIRMNTFLGGPGSPSDAIVVTGSATTMNQSLAFNNINQFGIGAGTASIRVVDADAPGATTSPTAFVLDGQARSGFTSYMLARGMPGDPDSWFLVPNFVQGGTGTNAVGNAIGGAGVVVLPPNLLPAVPGSSFPPGSILPGIGPEIATYGAVPPIARVMGLTTLGTLRERMGDSADGGCCCTAVTTCCSQTSGTRTSSGAQGTATVTQTTVSQSTFMAPTDCNNRPAAWGRVFGQSIDNRYQAFADPQATGEIVGVEAGTDVWRGSLIRGHTDAAGVYFAYANADIDVNGLVTNLTNNGFMMARTGTLAFSGYSGGAYWTHTGPTGWYVDAVVQGTWYDGTASTQSASLPLRGSGLVTSLEGGYPIPIPIWWLGPRFVLEPQGQIIWQEVSFQDRNDGLGPVSLGSTEGFTGRLGLRGKWTLTAADGTVWQPYLQANIWRDWSGDATTTFGVGQVPLVEQATWLEFLGGVSARLNARWSVHAEGGYQFATGENNDNPYRRDGVKGSLGVRYTW